MAFWLAQHYARRVSDRPAAGLQFRADWLPRPAAADAAAEQAASRAAQAAAQEALANKPRPWLSVTPPCAKPQHAMQRWNAELAQYRAEIAAAKAANAAQPATRDDYNEAATRDLFIDLLLKSGLDTF